MGGRVTTGVFRVRHRVDAVDDVRMVADWNERFDVCVRRMVSEDIFVQFIIHDFTTSHKAVACRRTIIYTGDRFRVLAT